LARKSRLAKPSKKAGKRVNSSNTQSTGTMPVLFSLERCVSGKYCLSQLSVEDKAAFADSVFIRRSITWDEMRQASRHGVGTEKIAISAIKAPIPRQITEDVETLLALRFSAMAPMVGYRIGAVFFVLWFDHDFSLYNHG